MREFPHNQFSEATVSVCVSIGVCAALGVNHITPFRATHSVGELCKWDLLMNVFFHHIQVQSKYASYAHLGSPFTAPVCQAFRLNENIHGLNHARHPLLTSCRNTVRHGCYVEGNLENPQLRPTNEPSTLSLSEAELPPQSQFRENVQKYEKLWGAFWFLLASWTAGNTRKNREMHGIFFRIDLWKKRIS